MYDVLEICWQLENLLYDWEFVLSRNAVHYEWYELTEDSAVWECLSEDKNKSAIYKNMSHTLDFIHVY